MKMRILVLLANTSGVKARMASGVGGGCNGELEGCEHERCVKVTLFLLISDKNKFQ